MPVPVINDITSLFLYDEDQAIRPFQFYASESPTGWSASSIPTGLSISSSGKITGTPTTPGFYQVAITATNGSGSSVAVSIPMVVRAAPASDDGFVTLDFDLETGLVTHPTLKEGPLLFARKNNKLGVALGLVRNGILQRMDLTNVRVTLRDHPIDKPTVEIYDAAPLAPSASAALPRYRVALDFTGAAVKTMLSAHEGDKVAGQFAGPAEITLTWTAPDVDGSGTIELSRSCPSFGIHIAGEVV